MSELSEYLEFERWVEIVVAEQAHVTASRVTAASSINQDLGVGGDDGHDLLLRLRELTGADFADVEYDQYFAGESIFENATRQFTAWLKGESYASRTLTVGALATFMWEHGGRRPGVRTETQI